MTLITPVRNEASHSHSLSSLQCNGGGNWKGRVVRNVVCWDKESLIGKAKLCMQPKQKWELIHLPAHGKGRSALSRQAGLHRAWWLLRNIPHFPLLPPALSMTPHGLDHSLDQLSWLFVLPNPCASPDSLLVGQGKQHKRPWFSVGTSQN